MKAKSLMRENARITRTVIRDMHFSHGSSALGPILRERLGVKNVGPDEFITTFGKSTIISAFHVERMVHASKTNSGRKFNKNMFGRNHSIM